MEGTIIGLDQYNGSFIQKGFETPKQEKRITFDSIEEQLKNNFQKGLIDEDLFNKAIGELDLLKGGKAGVGEIREWGGKKYKKQPNGKWLEVSHSHGLTNEHHSSDDVEKAEKLDGGLADNKTPKDIAEKWGVTVEEVNNAIEDGSKVEMEHTKDESEAKEIAADHIYEKGLEYYVKLQEMEDEMGDSVRIKNSINGKATKTSHNTNVR